MLAVLLATAPAIPNDVGGKYVAGAYIVFVLLLLIYVAIMGMKLARIERDLTEIAAIAEERQAGAGRGSEEPSMSDSLASHESRGTGV
jgi:hypothetical protein